MSTSHEFSWFERTSKWYKSKEVLAEEKKLRTPYRKWMDQSKYVYHAFSLTFRRKLPLHHTIESTYQEEGEEKELEEEVYKGEKDQEDKEYILEWKNFEGIYSPWLEDPYSFAVGPCLFAFLFVYFQQSQPSLEFKDILQEWETNKGLHNLPMFASCPDTPSFVMQWFSYRQYWMDRFKITS